MAADIPAYAHGVFRAGLANPHIRIAIPSAVIAGPARTGEKRQLHWVAAGIPLNPSAWNRSSQAYAQSVECDAWRLERARAIFTPRKFGYGLPTFRMERTLRIEPAFQTRVAVPAAYVHWVEQKRTLVLRRWRNWKAFAPSRAGRGSWVTRNCRCR